MGNATLRMNDLSGIIVDTAYQVHKGLGPDSGKEIASRRVAEPQRRAEKEEKENHNLNIQLQAGCLVQIVM